MHASRALFASFQLRPILVDCILEAQLEDPYLMTMRKKVEKGEQSDFAIRDDGALVIGSSDSCHSRVIRSQQNLYPKFPPTIVVKLLQYSGSRVELRDGFSSYK